jgi:hypothetical protein
MLTGKRRMKLPRFTALGPLIALVLAVGVSAGHADGSASITTCGQTVTTNAVLANNLVCFGHGIVVGAPGITIDLKGFTVRGNRSADHFGIYDLGHADVTIKNGIVRNFDIGVYAGAQEVHVSNIVASGNTGDGIYIGDSSGSVRSSTASGNGSNGMYLNGVDETIQSSTAAGNLNAGLYVSGSSASVKSSTASGNGYFGINVTGDAAHVQSSTASGNVSGGIHVDGEAAVIKGNRSVANGFESYDSDLSGPGIFVEGYTTPPAGTNLAQGNDYAAECAPKWLC